MSFKSGLPPGGLPPREHVPPIDEKSFATICEVAYSRFGLHLRDGKQELVRTRLSKELRRLGLPDFASYVKQLTSSHDQTLEENFINLLTTNHTSFFREAEHFDYLVKSVLPQLERRGALEIWCAACATGEEAYTLAITLYRALGAARFRSLTIHATDISTRALDVARRATYEASRFPGVALDSLSDCVELSADKLSCRIRPELRSAVRFSHINLLRDWPFRQLFPVVFCRNVMIYFDRETQQKLVRRIGQQMPPGGYLFVGHSESLNGLDHGLKYVRPAIYQRAGSLGSASGYEAESTRSSVFRLASAAAAVKGAGNSPPSNTRSPLPAKAGSSQGAASSRTGTASRRPEQGASRWASK